MAKAAKIIRTFTKLKVSRSKLLPPVTLLVLAGYFSLTSPAFLQEQNIYNILRQSAVLTVAATGASFIILQGSIDLSVSSVATLAGIVSAVLIRDLGLGLWAVPAALLVGAAAGSVNGFIFAYGKVPSFLTTLGLMFALDGVSLIVCGGSPVPIRDRGFLALGIGNVGGSLPTIAVSAFAVYLISIVVAFHTKFGRYMYAIGGNERVATLSGVPVKRFKLYSFILSGAMAAFAGVLLSARMQAGVPRSGDYLLLDGIAAVVMGGTALTGGVGGPQRTLLGVMIMGILSNGLNLSAVDPYLQIVLKGCIVVVAVFLTLDRTKVEIMK